jgi:hypothetical protein
MDACSLKVCCSCYKANVIGFCKKGGDGDCQGQEDELGFIYRMDEPRTIEETMEVHNSIS